MVKLHACPWSPSKEKVTLTCRRMQVKDSLTVSVNDSAPRLACRRPVDDHVTDVKGTTNADHGKSDDRNRPGWSCRDRPGSSRCSLSARVKSQHQHSPPTNTLPGCPGTTRESTASCQSPTAASTAAATRHRSTGGNRASAPSHTPRITVNGAHLHTRGINSLTVCDSHRGNQDFCQQGKVDLAQHKHRIASGT